MGRRSHATKMGGLFLCVWLASACSAPLHPGATGGCSPCADAVDVCCPPTYALSCSLACAFPEPFSVATDARGNVFATTVDRGAATDSGGLVRVFRPDGTQVGELGKKPGMGFGSRLLLACDPRGGLFVTDFWNARVVYFPSPVGGPAVAPEIIPVPGGWKPGVRPFGIAAAAPGKAYVGAYSDKDEDNGLFALEKESDGWKWRTVDAVLGGKVLWLAARGDTLAVNVRCDSKEAGGHHIRLLRKEQGVGEIPPEVQGAGGANSRGIAFTAEGDLLLVNQSQGRLNWFRSETCYGLDVASLPTEPLGIAVAPDGTVFVVSRQEHPIQALSRCPATEGK